MQPLLKEVRFGRQEEEALCKECADHWRKTEDGLPSPFPGGCHEGVIHAVERAKTRRRSGNDKRRDL